jgi:hypothetical protein
VRKAWTRVSKLGSNILQCNYVSISEELEFHEQYVA